MMKSEQIEDLNLAVDLRPLNYPVFTGVNIYVIHFLYQLKLIKENYPKVRVTAIGLKEIRKQVVEEDFPFLRQLFDEYVSLSVYLRLRFISLRLLNVCMGLFTNLFGWYSYSLIKKYDYLFLLQPKPLWKNPKTRQICVFHDIYGVLEPSATNVFNRLYVSTKVVKTVAKESHRIWSVSLSTAWDLTKFLKVAESKIKLIYSAKPFLKPLAQTKPNEPNPTKLPNNFVLALSGIEKRKNWHNLLLAHNHLQKSGVNDYSLVLAGRIVDQKYFEYLQKLVTRLKIPKVKFMLSPSENQKNDLIARSLFMVYPSFYEGFGFPILEAFANNKVVLTSRVSSMPEIGNNSCLYINPLNYLDIARGLGILLTDKEFKQSLEINIKKNLNKFSWDELYQSLEEIVNSMN